MISSLRSAFWRRSNLMSSLKEIASPYLRNRKDEEKGLKAARNDVDHTSSLNSNLSYLILTSSLFLLGTLASTAQENLNLFFRKNLEHQEEPTEFHVLVKGNESKVHQWVNKADGHYKYKSGSWHAILLPSKGFTNERIPKDLEQIRVSISTVHPLNDTMRLRNDIIPVHQGVHPLDSGLTGEGVIMGYIDSGIDFNHPDLQDENGKTRVLSIWDQTLSSGGNPSGYGYGQVWDSTDINSGNCPHVDQSGFYGHGTSVAGIGSGNGLATGNFKGAAPESDIVMVANDFGSSMASVADAIDYILDIADSQGKPCVINVSLGSYSGAHDGKDAVAQIIDNKITSRKGQVLVCAAGNSGHLPPYHLHQEVTNDTSFTWFEYNPSSILGTGAVAFEAWADTGDFENVAYAMGVDKVTTSIDFRGRTNFHNITSNLNTTLKDTIYSPSGDTLAQFEFWAEQINGRYRLQVISVEPDSSQYKFRLMTTGGGHFDVWSSDESILGTSRMVPETELPSNFPSSASYGAPDTLSSIVNSWACSPEIITVGNHTGRKSYLDINGNVQVNPNRISDLSPSSSIGPTRNGNIKPDITATGNVLLTASKLSFIQTLISTEPYKVAQDSMHVKTSGTSMASPVVAGIAALYLQHCPQASNREVRNQLIQGANSDPYTGTTPNHAWGAGKVNGYNTVSSGVQFPSITPVGDLVLCEGDSLQLMGEAGFMKYSWNHGDSTRITFVGDSGLYSLAVKDSSGCPGTSESLKVFIRDAPSSPALMQDGDTLYTISSKDYQWYHSGNPIQGATNQSYVVDSAGYYYVRITDQSGCWNNSDTVYISPLNIENRNQSASTFQVFPNPSSGKLHLKTHSEHPSYQVTLLNLMGQELLKKDFPANQSLLNLDLQELDKGVYELKVKGSKQAWTFKIIRQ